MNTRSIWMVPAVLALALGACAPDAQVDGERDKAPVAEGEAGDATFPPGARVLHVDRSATMKDALELLAQRGNDKTVPYFCLSWRFGLRSVYNGDYVRAESSQGFLLRAHASTAGAAGDFRVCTGYFSNSASFWSVAAEKFVRASLGGGDKALRAEAVERSSWETFYWVESPFGYALNWSGENSPWLNPVYVSGEFGELNANFGMLRARGEVVDVWELWTLVDLDA